MIAAVSDSEEDGSRRKIAIIAVIMSLFALAAVVYTCCNDDKKGIDTVSNTAYSGQTILTSIHDQLVDDSSCFSQTLNFGSLIASPDLILELIAGNVESFLYLFLAG